MVSLLCETWCDSLDYRAVWNISDNTDTDNNNNKTVLI